jgi:hypothetical protein
MSGALKLNPALGAILPMARLDPPAAALVSGCTDTAAAIRLLAEADEMMAAARLGAFALPRREAVWWASMCSAHAAPPDQPPLEVRTREAAELWVRQQEDTSRRLAMDLARQVGFAAPEAWVGVAAFWSGNSMAPVGQPVVPPAPHLTGTAVSGAVALACIRDDPFRRNERLGQFLTSLWDIAGGGAGRIPQA